jgi:NAD(P)-dependent dehydrogenase (short-subunit alcohol dehydrogenase family)
MSSRPLAGQVVVITGASSGVGRCTAQHLAAQGARVVLTARRAEALDALAREIEGAGRAALAVPADVAHEDEVRQVARAAVERFGRIDGWVNCASVFLQASVEDTTAEEYRRVLDVNFMGVVHGTRCALEQMRAQGSGTIVQISSVLGRRAMPYFGAYAASKAGVDMLSQALRAELWGTDIHVSTLYLPTVDTPIYEHSRSRTGAMTKPAPPVLDPAVVARIIGEMLVSPVRERAVGAMGHAYLGVLPLLPVAAADWLVQHVIDFLRADRPDVDDNLDRPMADVPRVRDGWQEPGWRGVTVRETVSVLPWESMLGAAALGFVAARLLAPRRTPR